jgi:hypothetical protein
MSARTTVSFSDKEIDALYGALLSLGGDIAASGQEWIEVHPVDFDKLANKLLRARRRVRKPARGEVQ